MGIEIITAIFLFCIIGCGIQCHKLGQRKGVLGTVEFLIASDYLNIADEDKEEAKESWLKHLFK